MRNARIADAAGGAFDLTKLIAAGDALRRPSRSRIGADILKSTLNDLLPGTGTGVGNLWRPTLIKKSLMCLINWCGVSRIIELTRMKGSSSMLPARFGRLLLMCSHCAFCPIHSTFVPPHQSCRKTMSWYFESYAALIDVWALPAFTNCEA